MLYPYKQSIINRGDSSLIQRVPWNLRIVQNLLAYREIRTQRVQRLLLCALCTYHRFHILG